MAAIKRICSAGSAVKNTGTNSSLLPVATAMLFFCPKDFKLEKADLVSEETLKTKFETAIHADLPNRVYPLFGNAVPIRLLTNTKGTDVIVTLDDGTPVFVAYGTTTKQYGTTDGGLCFQKIVQSYNGSNFRVIEVDKAGHILAHDNKDGTFSGLVAASIFAPAPDMADLANPAKTYLQVAYNPAEYVGNAVLLNGGNVLLDLMGLIDLHLAEPDNTPSSATKLIVGLHDDCCEESAIEEVPDEFYDETNFIVTNATTGAVVPITAANKVGDTIELIGTFTSGTPYNVASVKPSELYPKDVVGYEIGSATASISFTTTELEAPNSPPSEDDFEEVA